jgi:hypothetical protein
MRVKFSVPLLLLVVLSCTSPLQANESPDQLARIAVSEDAKAASLAIAKLRSLGPAGLETMLRVHASRINEQLTNPQAALDPNWQRLSDALDAVSQQKNSYLSGLYWYTDFGQAKAAAKKSGKPILSLRLLGNLNEEFSCANSRFFRTILYSNQSISQILRDQFVLHWKSVRPAPRVTIDFGDGRKLERTLTGNSIHYILDTEGRPIEALPGLYGPAAFLRALLTSERLFAKLQQEGGPNAGQSLMNYRREGIQRLNADWLNDIEKTGGTAPKELMVVRRPDGTPEALAILQLAMTKMVTEATMLRSFSMLGESLGKITDEPAWRRIAELHRSDAILDSRSIGLISRQTQKVFAADGSRGTHEEGLKSLMDKLQMNIALDTVRNEYLMRTKLYVWMIEDRGRSDLETFNQKVYAELFLTPASDPWLGLFTPDTYVALEGGGIR